jgi:transcriptional regulator with XRE-family HTH domain
MNVGKRILHLREQMGLSQKDLAEKVSIDKSVMNRIELGTRSIRDDELFKFADVLGVTTDYILGRNGIDGADEKEQLDIEKAIHDNVVMMYGGVTLDDEDKAKLEQTLRLVFWDKIKEKKNKRID